MKSPLSCGDHSNPPFSLDYTYKPYISILIPLNPFLCFLFLHTLFLFLSPC
ncbi:unnamed protein product [Meloidogyne enterolobii]|uniref:Uncharacterized protein n=1 Tax=Meloidogyne enterolobii TaxID=390850 RepID=A0ACB0YUD7_MELEN